MRGSLLVTLGLVATGSVMGAVVGSLSLWIATAVFGVGPQFRDWELLEAGAKAGALAGSIIAPIGAWSLLRRVPLWRAIAVSALGTALGSFAGSAVAASLSAGLAWSILGGPIGFAIAAILLRTQFGTRSSSAVECQPARVD